MTFSIREYVVLALFLTLCELFVVSLVETVSMYELNALGRAVEQPYRYTLRPQCQKYYNIGQHEDWAECMGVSYRQSPEG